MTLTSSNAYDSQTYALLALFALDILGHVFGMFMALTELCKRCGAKHPHAPLRPGDSNNSAKNTEASAKTQRKIGMNLSLTQLWTCGCTILSNLSLMFILLEYVGFHVIYGQRMRESWMSMAIVPRLISILLTFWFRAYDRPVRDSQLESQPRLRCLNDNAWTMWLVGSVLSATIVWLTVHNSYVLYNTVFCTDSDTGLMCSRVGTIVPLVIAATVTLAVYSIFSSVLSDYTEMIGQRVLSRGTGDSDVDAEVRRQLRTKQCFAVFIMLIGVFQFAAMIVMAMMAYYPAEYDKNSRFESAASGKTGAVLFLFVFLFLIMGDYLYVLHVVVPWTSCCSGYDGTRLRSVSPASSAAAQIEMFTGEVPSHLPTDSAVFSSTASTEGLGVPA